MATDLRRLRATDDIQTGIARMSAGSLSWCHGSPTSSSSDLESAEYVISATTPTT
jgi:hypothetical protein